MRKALTAMMFTALALVSARTAAAAQTEPAPPQPPPPAAAPAPAPIPPAAAVPVLPPPVVTANPANKLRLELSNGGTVVIQLRPDAAPAHVERIQTLVRRGFYNGVGFHRVIPGFMAQGGDPSGTGTSGSDKPNLQAEFSKEPHVRGVCSMARTSAPNSANSQFFICFDDATFLDRQYTVWGEVVEGMEHVDALPKGEPPRNPGRIVSLKVAADA